MLQVPLWYILQNVCCLNFQYIPSMCSRVPLNVITTLWLLHRRTRRQDIRNGDPLSQCSDLQHHGTLLTSLKHTFLPSPLLPHTSHACVFVLMDLYRRCGRLRWQCGGQECVRCGEQQYVSGVQPQVSESPHLLAASEAQWRSQAWGVCFMHMHAWFTCYFVRWPKDV